ncbi:MAG TPA: hypothetical protein VFI00_10350 [Kribbella sp.]|nr:hypothetical protein [Kribbella sp.]
MRRTDWLTTYRLLWSVLTGLVGGLGLVVGLFFVPSRMVFPLLFIASLIAATVAAHAWSKAEGAGTSARAGRAAVTGGVVIAGIVACAGYIVLLGVAGLGLVVVLGITSPPVVRWCSLRVGHIPGRRFRRRKGALTTAELCRQWRDSYDALRHASSAAARLRIVEARQHYLDELERRHPLGLKAWLGDNASAAGDPSRFLVGEEGDSR